MPRPSLSVEKIAPEAQRIAEDFHADVVREVSETVAKEPWVIVGMAQNPFVRKARNFLTEQGISFRYLEYGSYLSQWRVRLAIKMWAGFPTFPMVFRQGVLLGGHSEIVKLQQEGKLK